MLRVRLLHRVGGVEVGGEAGEVLVRVLLRLALEARERRLLADERPIAVKFFAWAVDRERAGYCFLWTVEVENGERA